LDYDLYSLLEKKGLVVNTDNFNNIVDKFKSKYEFLGNGTSLHIVVPTHRCNMDCIYCFASSCDMKSNPSNTDMSYDTAREIVDFIMKSPSKAITIEFQGGEPIARFDIIKVMVERAKELNKTYCKDLRFALVSNFTLLTDSIVDWLIDNGVTFCTSLDGPKFVHDKNRFFVDGYKISSNKNDGVKKVGSYDRVVYWINRINKKYKDRGIDLKVNALMTITRSSLPYYKEIIDDYIRLNLNPINIRPLTQVGRALEQKDSIFYSSNEFFDFYEKSLKYLDELSDKGIFVEERIRELFRVKILFNIPMYHTEYDSPCGATTGQIVYYVDGGIYTCNEALGREEFMLGSVFESRWQDLFKKKEVSKAILNSMLENNVKCDRCVYKPYCGTCMVENFYNFSKFNFYPEKTFKHHEVVFHCERFFDYIMGEIKKEL
jgi:His-Xaa-Ser system radical SAM maturase HxsB